MLAVFENYIKEQIPALTNEEIGLIDAAAVQTTVRKKQVLLEAGKICRYKIFIARGFLRTYRTAPDGSEHVMQFSQEGNWTTEGESYSNGTPSAYYIDALEYSELMIWHKDSFDALLHQIPALKELSSQLVFHNLHTSRARLYKAISATPEEKYEDFVKTYPGILTRVPLRMVASYLGVSLKTLTRIRQTQLQR